MFVKLIGKGKQGEATVHEAILVERTHDDTRATLFVFYPEFGVAKFVPRVPDNDNTYIDDDGSRGEHWEFDEPDF